ncbi:MAG: hypothetical protein QOG04_1030 [Actinomycetota bacterium]|nr:hypothetical protein [Actinomycetota bacterium]
MSRIMKLQSLLVVFAVVISSLIVAVPAFAAFGGTVTFANGAGNAISGLTQTYAFKVVNSGTGAIGAGGVTARAGDPSINYVRFKAENPFGEIVPTQPNALAGWDYSLRDTDSDLIMDTVIYKNTDAAQKIAPADTAGKTFSFSATAPTVAVDQAIKWSVQISSDGGTTGKSLAGTPTTTVRPLVVTAVNLAGPVGATDGTVTTGQPNISVASVVQNYGSDALVVDPSLASNNPTDTVTDLPAVSIDPGQNVTFPFNVDLGSATTARSFTASASAPGATAASIGGAAITGFESAPTFSYPAANTVSPGAGVSGSSATFAMNLNKDNTPPSVDFNLANTLLTFSDTAGHNFSTSLATPTNTTRDAQSLGLAFASVTIPGSAATRDYDGVYSGSLTVSGTDSNGAPVLQTISLGDDRYEIDNLVPYVLPTLTGPNGQTVKDSSNQDVPVARDGQTLTIGGSIKKSADAGAPADATATITDCWLVVEDAANAPVSRTPIALSNCKSTAGTISGTTTLQSGGLPAGNAYVSMIVKDVAGNSTQEIRSSAVIIDNLAPVITSAITGCGAGAAVGCVDQSTIRVFLSEPVKGDFLAADFMVTSHVVSSASSACTATTACSSVTLTLGDTFTDDARPTVKYAFQGVAPVRTQPADGPKQTLAGATLTAADGIVPDLPTLDTVTQDGRNADGSAVSNPRAEQDGAFYTNQEAPVFEIGGLAQFYTGLVAIDTNNSGDYEPNTDQIVAQCIVEAAAADSVSCPAAAPLGGDGSYSLLVASRDGQGNLSKGSDLALDGKSGRPAALIIDNVAPTPSGYTATGTDLVVAFSEPLGFGRDAFVDWLPREILANGKRESFDVSSVSGTGASRTVAIDDTDYVVGDADELIYNLEGTTNEAYQDRAGNYLGDKFILVAGA